MELIASLIFLSLLVIPPMILAGKEAFQLLMNKTGNSVSEQQSKMKAVRERHSVAENATMYDGMITVEIPIAEPQVIAYEPVIPHEDGHDIEIIPPGKMASSN